MSPTDSVYKPGTTVRKARVIIDADYDFRSFGDQWHVVVPGAGTVACFGPDEHSRAVILAQLYNSPSVTRSDILAFYGEEGP
jgi:hypothetical protein